MLKVIDDILNSITMYRLTLYYLLVLLIVAGSLTISGTLPFSLLDLAFSTAFITTVCYLTNHIFRVVFKTQSNLESLYITALILSLIISPAAALSRLPFLFWVSVLAMSSKFILTIGRKHLFNPAAIAVAITAFTINSSANWWVGNPALLPFVIMGGLLIVRKIRRTALVASFLIAATISITLLGLAQGSNPLLSIKETLMYSPLFFFAFLMLTEPLTTPPTKRLQVYYGALIGLIFSPSFHLGDLYFTPELTLLIGNVFSYLVSPKNNVVLKLKEKIKLAPDIYNFVFQSDKDLVFEPGQYLEWTFAHNRPDSRGTRRYFTIASSPTEKDVDFGIKFYGKPSSFKTNLLTLKTGSEITGGGLAGDFVLPKDQNLKLAFVAGGIGITPFRSMIKYLLDTNQRRDIVLLYLNKTAPEIVYQDIFGKAADRLGIKVIYGLTDDQNIPENWPGLVGIINSAKFRQVVPDFQERQFYLSGPHSLVTAYEEILHNLGVTRNKVTTDYFPGFA